MTRPETDERTARAGRAGVLVDGVVAPVGEREHHRGLFSGKKHRSGQNVQVVTDLDGRAADVGEPVPDNPTHEATWRRTHRPTEDIQRQKQSQWQFVVADRLAAGMKSCLPHDFLVSSDRHLDETRHRPRDSVIAASPAPEVVISLSPGRTDEGDARQASLVHAATTQEIGHELGET